MTVRSAYSYVHGYSARETQRLEDQAGSVRELIHHLIDMAQPKDGQKVYAAVGVPAEALKVNKLAIRDAVREYADTLMVVSYNYADCNIIKAGPSEYSGPYNNTTKDLWSPSAFPVEAFNSAPSPLTPGEPEPTTEKFPVHSGRSGVPPVPLSGSSAKPTAR